MAFWKRNGQPSTDLVPVAARPEPEVEEHEPVEEHDDTDFIWRCTSCGAMGTSRDSLHRHIGSIRRGRRAPCEATGIREYVLRVTQEYEAKAAEVAASGTWIVVKLPENTPEGEVQMPYNGSREDPWPTTVIESASGLGAIQEWYKTQVDRLRRDATESDREAANGRYVAIDFFTGHRAEALVESEWRANVAVAEGSHT